MSDLISRTALLAEFDPNDKTEFDTVGVRCYIQAAPTIETAPIVHGEWKYNPKYGEYICTHCNDWGVDDDEKTPHCPNCGAKMDKKNSLPAQAYREAGKGEI